MKAYECAHALAAQVTRVLESSGLSTSEQYAALTIAEATVSLSDAPALPEEIAPEARSRFVAAHEYRGGAQ